MLSAIQGEEGTTVSLEVGGDGRGPAHRGGHPPGDPRGYRHLDHDGKPGGPGDHPELLRWHRRPGKAGGVAALQEEGAQALVFDLRNNPGGYVTELTEILDYLLPEGNIFISRTSDGEEVTYTSDASCVDLPMAVMVNANSYSARSSLPLSSGNLWALRWSGSRPAARGIPRSSSICPTAAPLACLRPGTIPARGVSHWHRAYAGHRGYPQ